MEASNNNNLLLKGLAILLIAILGLTVYRTETIKRDVAKLSKSVGALSSRLDAISQDGVPQSAVTSGQSVSKKQFNDLSKAVSALESKVANMVGTVDRLSSSQKNAGSAARSTGTVTSSSAPKTETVKENPAPVAKTAALEGRVSVSAKTKLENRYVTYRAELPKVSKGPEGQVVIGITVTQTGKVVSVKINNGTTIVDDDIIDACKEAALRTDFSVNWDSPDRQQGTITYTFTAK